MLLASVLPFALLPLPLPLLGLMAFATFVRIRWSACQSISNVGLEHRMKNKQTNKQTNKPTNQQTNKQANKQTSKQANKQTRREQDDKTTDLRLTSI
jgi:hypothetical protein